MDRNKVFAYLDEHFQQYLADVQQFLRTPSVSYTGEGIRETAGQVADMIRTLGGTAELVETPGHPVVYGEIDSGAKDTLLIYGMYDVMPADEPGWIVDPWGAEIRDFLDLGPCVIARGAVNTKGPLSAFFGTLDAIQKAEGRLPVNLIFAIEGEEEFGSRNFPAFAEQYKEKLKQAQAMFFPFFYCDQEGTPTVTLGTKGLCYFELTARGGDWGGPTTRGIHGSYAAWVANPNWRLINALASMKNEHEEILVDGFYADVIPPNADDLQILQDLEAFRDDSLFLQLQEVKRFKFDAQGVELYKHLYFDPTLNINGYASGFTEEGTKTLLPHQATAKVDIRMVPGMEPEATVAKVKAHLAKHGYHDIEMKMHNLYPWSKVSVQEPVVQALLTGYTELGRRPMVVPLNPGSAPYYVFQRTLGMPYIAGGLGHGSRQHSSNEYCTVEGIRDFQKSVVAFFGNYVQLQARGRG
ncbi:MAG TPA: M20/M25/M40 family metallo-hydrolase [Symbiobacteriaceae bacterium]|nr:M20/M25/M40 family metallo-hydrolase [Symbiobacteriaceae bacterium]